jgi:hypothetical protein
MWLLRELILLILAPGPHVKFPQFFLGDQVTSTQSVIYDWQFSLCYYSADVWRPECMSHAFGLA